MPTCFPASMEQISSEYGLRPRTYKNYLKFIEWYYPMRKEQREARNDAYAEMVDTLAWDLGRLSCEDIIFRHANTPRGMNQIVRQLLSEGCAVAVDIRVACKVVHTVGLIPTEEPGFVTLVSNQIPYYLQGVIPIMEVAKKMNPNNDDYMPEYTFNNSNITALPPAA